MLCIKIGYQWALYENIIPLSGATGGLLILARANVLRKANALQKVHMTKIMKNYTISTFVWVDRK